MGARGYEVLKGPMPQDIIEHRKTLIVSALERSVSPKQNLCVEQKNCLYVFTKWMDKDKMVASPN